MANVGSFPTHHRNFIALVKPRTHVAILVNLVGKVFPLRHLKTLAGKEFRSSREQADAIHPMPLGFRHQRLHQLAAPALALGSRRNRDGTNLSKMRAIKMQRTASDDAAVFLQHHKIPHVLANLRQRPRQQVSRRPNSWQSDRESAWHPAKSPYACAWRLTSSRKDSIFFLAAASPCRTRAGAVPPTTSCIASTAAGFRHS